jgi:hypothetical protein
MHCHWNEIISSFVLFSLILIHIGYDFALFTISFFNGVFLFQFDN